VSPRVVLNPARRPGHAHAVLGCEHTRTAGAVRQRLWARASHPKARSHNPITAPERFNGKFLAPSQSRCGKPHRNPAVHEFPLSAHPQSLRISRVMRFATGSRRRPQAGGHGAKRVTRLIHQPPGYHQKPHGKTAASSGLLVLEVIRQEVSAPCPSSARCPPRPAAAPSVARRQP